MRSPSRRSLAASLVLVSCGGRPSGASSPDARPEGRSGPPVVTSAPAAPAVASAKPPAGDAVEACVVATIAAESACDPEREDPNALARARVACEAAKGDGTIAAITECSLAAADDTHEACRAALATCLAARGVRRAPAGNEAASPKG